MKIVILMLAFFFSILCTEAQRPVKIEFEGGALERSGVWAQLFSDEFNGSSLDTSTWYTYYPYGVRNSDMCGFCRTHDTTVSNQIYLDKNLSVSDGNLEISTLNETCEWMGYKSSFSAGLVHSKRVFNSFYRYEIRCRIPEGTIFWPAFWMFGWSTEIDVFEFMSNNTRDIYLNVHKWKDGKTINQSKKIRGIDFAKDFHVYAVEYEQYFVKYFIDGSLIYQIPRFVKRNGKYIKKTKLKKGTYYLNPAYPTTGDEIAIIAGNAVSRYRANDAEELAGNTFPAIMYVDYIRVYERIHP